MESMLSIGPKKDAIEAARKSILDILNARADQETIRQALTCFHTVCSVGTVNISNCSFVGDKNTNAVKTTKFPDDR